MSSFFFECPCFKGPVEIALSGVFSRSLKFSNGFVVVVVLVLCCCYVGVLVVLRRCCYVDVLLCCAGVAMLMFL